MFDMVQNTPVINAELIFILNLKVDYIATRISEFWGKFSKCNFSVVSPITGFHKIYF